MGLVVAGARFPGRREDFDNDDAYSTWRKSELESIQHLILQLATANKDIVRSDHARSADGTSALSPTTSYQSSPMPSSSSFRSSLGRAPYPDFGFDDVGSARPTSMMLSADDDSAADLTFVPPDPRLYYARLLEVCLGHDLEIVKELDAHEEVSLRILSRASHELLVECALRWRLMLPYRATAFLEEMARRYSNDEIPIIQCVTEAIADIDRVVGEWDYDRWTIKDVRIAFCSRSLCMS